LFFLKEPGGMELVKVLARAVDDPALSKEILAVAAFTSPTLFAPDLELRPLGPEWHWLAWAEVVLGVTILFGIYVRFFAGLLIMMTLLAAWLFGEAILA
jgi:uncharacterized membrane protein YphA (DoxX/SURF4 family)